MPHPMSPEREKEFSELSAYINFYMTIVHGIDSSNPVNAATALDEVVRKYGKSKALNGLRQATNDTIEELNNRPTEYIEILDDALRAAGILTVSEIRHRYATAYQRILRRGSIKNETEYHLINGIVVDLASTVTSEERVLLQAMLDAYE
jgi:hypothetical protein